MKFSNDPNQGQLFDPFEGVISPTGRKQIADGWQGMFRDIILQLMPIAKFGEKFCDDKGRPTAELYSMVGLLMIRQFQGWTVPQTHEAALFRTDIQFALNLQPGFEISQRTIERHLKILQDDEHLNQEIFDRVTEELLSKLEVSVKKQRLDSTHVLSDMATFGRAQMIGVALRRFFAKVDQHHGELLQQFAQEETDNELLLRYRKQSDSRIFADVRGTEARRVVLQQAAEDLHRVITYFQNIEPLAQWKIYLQLQTIFDQQCEIREEFVEVRRKTGGNVIVNPSDPDATYSGHKGAGYQVQIAETYNDSGEPNLITSAFVETAVTSDHQAVEKVIDALESRDILPDELLADAAYGADENVELAKKKDVDLVAPVPGSKKYDPEELSYEAFELTDQNELAVCPAGHAPESTRFNPKRGYVWAQMDADRCATCPLLDRCRVQRASKSEQPSGRIQFDLSTVRSDRRRRLEQGEEFRERYRMRSGIEGTNGCLKRLMGLGRLRVRGMRAVSSAILLKLAGWNLLRAVAMRNKRSKTKRPVFA